MRKFAKFTKKDLLVWKLRLVNTFELPLVRGADTSNVLLTLCEERKSFAGSVYVGALIELWS